MNGQSKKFIMTVLLSLSVLTSSGCILLLAGTTGGGVVAFVKGVLEQNIDQSVPKVYRAGIKAANDLGLYITDKKLNRHDAMIHAEYEDGKKVKIHITALTERSSKISIRIGVFGNKDESQVILDKILKKL